MMLKELTLYLMGSLYVLAGTMHFMRPKFFLRIMPPYIPFHKAMVYISGAIEIALGVALFVPALSPWAAWGVIALLIAVFPANVYHFQSGGAGMKIPAYLLAIRLPLQGVLIAWAYWYAAPIF